MEDIRPLALALRKQGYILPPHAVTKLMEDLPYCGEGAMLVSKTLWDQMAAQYGARITHHLKDGARP